MGRIAVPPCRKPLILLSWRSPLGSANDFNYLLLVLQGDDAIWEFFGSKRCRTWADASARCLSPLPICPNAISHRSICRIILPHSHRAMSPRHRGFNTGERGHQNRAGRQPIGVPSAITPAASPRRHGQRRSKPG